MSAVLELRRVTRIHGTGHVRVDALVDTSLVVDAGEMVAVMGPSGSGKTTLLALAGGLDEPTDGVVLVEGEDLGSLDRSTRARLRRRRVGYVFQELNLIDVLTASENVSLPLELDGVGGREARASARIALEKLGLSELADRFPEDLSGGERQRVAIARATVGNRILLLADEPTGALDSLTGESVLRLMRQHCDDGGAAVLVTHDARLAAWADRIVFLQDGHLVDESSRPVEVESLLGEAST
ncbi:MAG: ABC transporter ATP-binding protein [Actinobacteria bacterium]|nr:ABC transporter ATP-binding protein [Actinomycetota bacterium]